MDFTIITSFTIGKFGRTMVLVILPREPDMNPASTLRVEVWRGARQGQFEQFEVPRRDSQTILDVVTHIQRHLDPALSYRYACRVGMCGSCAMRVNGVARWTCRTHVSKVAKNGLLRLEPLANMPVIKDLAVDMAGFFDKQRQARGQFKGAASRRDPVARISPDTAARRAADAGIECIGCAVCYSSCDVASWRPDFLGPAALNRAWTLVNDERDVQQHERLLAVAGDAGCHACHSQGSCTLRCPKQLTPTASIAGLKRHTVKTLLSGETP